MIAFAFGVLVLVAAGAGFYSGRLSAWYAVEDAENRRINEYLDAAEKYGALDYRYREMARDRDRLAAKIAGVEIDAKNAVEKIRSLHAAQLREHTEAARESGRRDACDEVAERIRELADEFAETDEAEDEPSDY